MIMRWQNMTEQPFMNIQTWQLAATNGEAAILCIPEEKFAVFCSPLPITG